MSISDFETVKHSLKEFLRDKNTKAKLSHILDKKSNDWEKWFQIEFEFFLEHTLKYSAKREVKAKINQKHQTGRQYAFVDLIFRKKHTRVDRFIYLEFKLAKRATILINNMWEDLSKNRQIVSSHYTNTGLKRRSLWCIGFYRDFSPVSLNRAEDSLYKDYSKYYSIHHEPIYICKCRGKRHFISCNKVGLVIIGSGSDN